MFVDYMIIFDRSFFPLPFPPFFSPLLLHFFNFKLFISCKSLLLFLKKYSLSIYDISASIAFPNLFISLCCRLMKHSLSSLILSVLGKPEIYFKIFESLLRVSFFSEIEEFGMLADSRVIFSFVMFSICFIFA